MGVDKLQEHTCVKCGCTDFKACPEGCEWVWRHEPRKVGETKKLIGLCSVCFVEIAIANGYQFRRVKK